MLTAHPQLIGKDNEEIAFVLPSSQRTCKYFHTLSSNGKAGCRLARHQRLSLAYPSLDSCARRPETWGVRNAQSFSSFANLYPEVVLIIVSSYAFAGALCEQLKGPYDQTKRSRRAHRSEPQVDAGSDATRTYQVKSSNAQWGRI